MVGCMLITLLRHCDRVKIACLAQLVNVIAPIMAEGGGVWRQTIFYPFLHASLFGRGEVLLPVTDCPKYDSKDFTDVPVMESVAVTEEDRLTVFAVNRSETEPMRLECDARGFLGFRVREHIVMTHEDRYAVNSLQNPNNVRPQILSGAEMDGGKLTAVLPPLSWNVLRLEKNQEL